MNPKENAVRNEVTGCLEWLGSSFKNGYGQLWVKGEGLKLAHRISYIENVGEISKGLCVLHKCDNRKCVNPEHLWLGTQKDNVQDCIAKGRRNKVASPKVIEVARLMGLSNRGRKLTEDHKNKIALGGIGRIASEKVRNFAKIMGNGNIGRKHSEESRKNMSLSHIGKIRGKYKRHKIWTEEEKKAFREKMRLLKLGTKLIDGKFVKLGERK